MAVHTKARSASSVIRGDCCGLLFCYSLISYCSRLKFPKSEWLYCFVRSLRPEIRDRGILQQPPDLESALNIAKLKELVVNS